MRYTFPDEDTLAKYLAMLREVIVQARFRAYEHDKQTAELLDAVENVPDLLCRWPDMKESIVLGELEAYETKYLNGADRFSGILKRGPRDNWQLMWRSKDENTEGE
jgi:hypothetical protein